MRKKTGAIRNACKNIEFVYLDPPFQLSKIDFVTGSAEVIDDESAMAAAAAGGEGGGVGEDEETIPRAWFLSKTGDGGVVKYDMMDESIGYLFDYLKGEKPFDGILGFSQGACMASILTALLEKPNLHPRFPSTSALHPFKFSIFCGGFLPAPTLFHPYYPIHTPTLHIIGKNDTIVTPTRSQTLIDRCTNGRVEEHDGGHWIPSKATWRSFLREYMTSFGEGGSNGDVPSPALNMSGIESQEGTREGTPVSDGKGRL